MLQRIVICTGGSLDAWALPYIHEGNVLIGADSGARFLANNGFQIDVAIGDFDSVTENELAVIRSCSDKMIECDPIDKNYTDTEMAVRLAMDMQPRELLILGALGTRFDHSLANVHLLALAAEQGVTATIIDNHNKISTIRDSLTLMKDGFDNVSLLPLTTKVSGITLRGFKYPLLDAELSIGQSLGISNVIQDASGRIELKDGMLLVIQSRD